jgi:hypothetical protein
MLDPDQPYDALRRLWWWIRGVDRSTYRARCARCGRTGQVHMRGYGCRRFVTPQGAPDD